LSRPEKCPSQAGVHVLTSLTARDIQYPLMCFGQTHSNGT